MEIVKLRYQALKKALTTLQIALEILKKTPNDNSAIRNLMRDGVIQRFEYCIDAFWKFLKIYLEVVQKTSIESSSPKSIIRVALQLNLITSAEYAKLIDSLSEGNLTSHSYNEELGSVNQII